MESFKAIFRNECPDEHWFRDLAEARTMIEGWRQANNKWREGAKSLIASG